MPLPHLADIEIFVAVVEHGGFSAAARVLGISKSYASKRVRALEDRVGADLLVRSSRHVAPTVFGERFHERCRVALEVLEDAEHLAALEREEPRGVLRVSLPASFGVRYLAPILARYAADHPHLRLEASFTDRKVALLHEGYDLALRIGSHLPDSELLARRVTSMERWLVASPAYLAARGEPAHPADLRAHVCLVYALAAEPRRWTFPTAGGDPLVVPVDARMTSDSGEALVEACRQDLGVTMLPDWMVWEDVRAGRLVRLLADTPAQAEHMWAVFPRHRHQAPKVARLVERVVAHLDPPPWRV